MIYTENYFQLWRIIADNKEEESEEMLAPGSGLACRCLCDTKEKYFIHLTRGGPCLAAACPVSTDQARGCWSWAEVRRPLTMRKLRQTFKLRYEGAVNTAACRASNTSPRQVFRLSFPIFVWRMITSQEICGVMMLFAEGQGAWDCYFDCCECEWVAH